MAKMCVFQTVLSAAFGNVFIEDSAGFVHASLKASINQSECAIFCTAKLLRHVISLGILQGGVARYDFIYGALWWHRLVLTKALDNLNFIFPFGEYWWIVIGVVHSDLDFG